MRLISRLVPRVRVCAYACACVRVYVCACVERQQERDAGNSKNRRIVGGIANEFRAGDIIEQENDETS